MKGRVDHLGILYLGLLVGMLGFMFRDGISDLVRVWGHRPEYSHGFFIPLISAFMAWQRLDAERSTGFSSSWAGFWVCLLAVGVFSVGQLSEQFLLVQYALLLVLTGLVLSFAGLTGLRVLWAPIVLLAFMIPLPSFVFRELSNTLQLISSQLGVLFIQAAGVSVFLEGNVIDLGSYQLEVVEACSGLRYLFPFASFGFICAYLYRGPWWHRAVIFASTVPITIASNSARIGAVGLLVEYSGISAAEGLLHYFEGWVIFMACVGVLLAEVWILNRSRSGKIPFGDAFELRFPGVVPPGVRALASTKPKPYLVSVALLTLTTGAFGFTSSRVESAAPARASFVEFPDRLDGWAGSRGRLDAPIIEKLGVTDYLLADYESDSGEWVNLYVAYYASQRSGRNTHSPQACIPAGGWRILNLSSPLVSTGSEAGHRVNRVEIERDGYRQLVYYWFEQRGRRLIDEHWIKAYLIWDALSRNRTDGALVRITTPLTGGEDWSKADRRLARFVAAMEGDLSAHIPDYGRIKAR